MADNVAITPGTGATVAADDIGGILHQRVKISVGADGSATDVSSAAPMPVADAATLAAIVAATGELGTGTAANAARVVGASDDPNRPRFVVAAAAAITRPADTTAYTALDAIGNSTTAGSVTPFSFTVSDANDAPVLLERIRLDTNVTGSVVSAKNVRMWLYRASPTPGAGDNAAFTAPKGNFIGSMSGAFRQFSDGGVAVLVPDEGARIVTLPTSGAMTVFGLLQAVDAFTPTSGATFTATVEGFQGRA